MVSSEDSEEKMDDPGEDGRESGRLKESEKVELEGGVVMEEEKVGCCSARRAARNCEAGILAILAMRDARDAQMGRCKGIGHTSYAFRSSL